MNSSDLPFAPIRRQFLKYIILAQSEADFKTKCNSIKLGNTRGFYTIEDYPNHPDVEYEKQKKPYYFKECFGNSALDG